ncbi:hypothetical protein HYT02_02240 [Candidatus Gottesmanbacteria bacterium]|nr:hypothetical protein [Candidatus Gottesmanbacteria bacterium]
MQDSYKRPPEEQKLAQVKKPTKLEQVIGQDPYKLQVVTEADSLLRDIYVSRRKPPAALKEYLLDPKREIFLTRREQLLGDKTTLSYLRSVIETEMKASAMESNQPTFKREPNTEKPKNRKGIKESKQASEFERSRRIKDSQVIFQHKQPSFSILSAKEDLGDLGEFTSFIHITQGSFVTVATIQKIIGICPNLKTIHLPPSLFDNMVGPSIRKLAQSYGIEIATGRIKESEIYNESRRPLDFKAKKVAFEETLQNPEKGKIFQLMQDFELNEPLVALMYFDTSNPLSLRKIAKKIGLTTVITHRLFSTIMHWCGIPSNDKAIITRANNLTDRVLYWGKANGEAKSRFELRQKCKVDDRIPPAKLIISQWEMWQKIMLLRKNRPELFDQLRDSKPNYYTVLNAYYGLEEETNHKTFEAIALERGVSKQAIMMLKNRGLHFLGLLDSD